MDVYTVLLYATILPILYIVWRKRSETQSRLPPGPKGHWLFGHMFSNWFNIEYFSQQAKQYGDVFSLQVFGKNVIVVNSFKAIKEAYSSEWTAGRVASPFTTEFTHGGHGLILSEGTLWRLHRRFTLTVLRDFGFGKSKIDQTIHDELQHLRATMEAQKGQSFCPQPAYSKAVSNVINSIVFNERCSEDPEFEKIIELSDRFAGLKQQSAFFSFFWPVLKLFPVDITGMKRLHAYREIIYRWVGGKYYAHKKAFDGINVKDYIDAFLYELKDRSEVDYFTETQLNQAIFDLFIAGLETSASVLAWATIFLAQFPEIQRKLYKEIELVLGDSKLPETGHRAKMHYTEAFLCEVQRFVTLLPLGVAHRATEAGQICGYDIPRDSIIVSNLLHAHKSKELWKDPDNFNPENFLDQSENLINTNYMIGFSAGKRVCLGEGLARQELFIFLVGLLQQYEFVADAKHRLPSVEDCASDDVLRRPRYFKVFARHRLS